MNVTKDRFKDRQLHMEDYLQMVSAEQGEYAEVPVYQRITKNNERKPERNHPGDTNLTQSAG